MTKKQYEVPDSHVLLVMNTEPILLNVSKDEEEPYDGEFHSNQIDFDMEDDSGWYSD